MQSKKGVLTLSQHVLRENLYRQLKEVLDFSFLRKHTVKYYDTEGQKSIDPEVFFKLMLVGFLENLNSDRRIMATTAMRLDIMYFIGYNIDEPLPWHSTLSRTRQLYGRELFQLLFSKVLTLCVEKVRQSTVEPVLGTLTNFLAMRKVNTHGIEQAQKHVLMACIAYNVKKYINYLSKNRYLAVAKINKTLIKGLNQACFSIFKTLIRLLMKTETVLTFY